MNKILFGVAVLFVCIGLSGCNERESVEDTPVLTKTYDTVDEMMNAIYQESLDYRETVTNITNNFNSKNDVVNYDTSQFIIHRDQLNSHDLTVFDRFGEYEKSRAELIQGLEYITNKDYENAWKYINRADGEVWYISQYTGYSVTQDFGLEDLSHFCYLLFKD